MDTAITNDEITGLVKKALDGDIEAYGQIYAVYLDRIYRYVFYQIRDEMKAQDITQEVFVKAWHSLRACRGKEHLFNAWLYRIAHNHPIDIIRRNRREVPLENTVLDAPGDTVQDAEAASTRQEVLKTVAGLSEPQKQIVLLKFIEGYDNEEIQKITGKRPGAIRAIQMRALKTLRQRLGGGGE